MVYLLMDTGSIVAFHHLFHPQQTQCLQLQGTFRQLVRNKWYKIFYINCSWTACCAPDRFTFQIHTGTSRHTFLFFWCGAQTPKRAGSLRSAPLPSRTHTVTDRHSGKPKDQPGHPSFTSALTDCRLCVEHRPPSQAMANRAAVVRGTLEPPRFTT